MSDRIFKLLTLSIKILVILTLLMLGGCAKHPDVLEEREWFKSSLLLTEHPDLFQSEYNGFHDVRREAMLGDDYRKGFAMWVSPEFSFNVDLPKNGMIRFAYGVGKNVFEKGVEVTLKVSVGEVNNRSVLGQWKLDLGDQEQLGRWFEVKIPIGAGFSGPRKLNFSHTVSGQNERSGLFIAHPTIVQPDDGGYRKRVIWISLDTLRADHLSCYGYKRETTPNIDDFADDATLFEYCISSSPWTFPSYASMLTGRYPSIAGALTGVRYLPKTETTLPEIISAGDVTTFSVVNAPFAGAPVGLQKGFDRQIYSREMYADVTFDIVQDWLDDHPTEDCFIFIHLYDVHLPYLPKEEYLDTFEPDYVGRFKHDMLNYDNVRLGKTTLTRAEKDHIIALYDEGILGADNDVGNFLDFLKSKDMYDDSLIVVNSDHGEEFWDHGWLEHGATHYDEILHVPMIVKGFGFDKGERVEQMIGNLDIFPTIIQWIGFPVPKEINAISLFETINGKVDSGSRRIISEQNYFDTEQKGVSSDDYRYILHTIDKSEELYDVKTDPKMLDNLAQDKRATSRGFRYFLTEYTLNEGTGWHVRLFRTKGDIEKKGGLFEGTISAPSGFASVERIKLADNDVLELDENILRFRITMQPWTNMAFDFTTKDENDMLEFNILTDGDPAAQQLVFLGPERVEASGIEFSMSILDPMFGLGMPSFGPAGGKHHGLYLWGNSESLRERTRPELDDATVAELKSLGYLNG